MNGTVLNKTELAAWRSLLARPDGAQLWLSAGVYLLSSLMLPCATSPQLSLAFIAVCAVFLFTQTHRAMALLAHAIPALLLFSLTGSFTPSAVFFAIVFGGATGALLLLSVRRVTNGLALLALPALAYLGALLATGDALAALLALLPLPVAVMGFFAVRGCKPFSPAIAAIALVLAITTLSAATVALAKWGLLDLDYLHAFVELLGDELIKMVGEAEALYPDMQVSALLTPLMIRNMVALVVNLSPGIFAVCCIIVAYYVWRTLAQLLLSFRVLPRLPRVFTTPMMSVVSAILFILAFIVSLVAGSAYTLVGAVAENFTLILTPAFTLIGFGALFGHSAQRSCLSLLLLIGMAYLMFNNPPLAFTIAALWGAIHSLAEAHRAAKSQNNNNSKGEP